MGYSFGEVVRTIAAAIFFVLAAFAHLDGCTVLATNYFLITLVLSNSAIQESKLRKIEMRLIGRGK